MEGCYRHHPLILRKNAFKRIGNLRGAFHRCAGRHENLHGKLVALGNRHELERARQENPGTYAYAHNAENDGEDRPVETSRYHTVVDLLHRHEETELLFTRCHRFLLQLVNRFLYKHILQERHKQLRHHKRHEKDYGHAPREIGKKVAEHPRHRKQEREECYGYSQCGRENCLEKFRAGTQGGRHMVHPL